jgi:hypothetical protein
MVMNSSERQEQLQLDEFESEYPDLGRLGSEIAWK